MKRIYVIEYLAGIQWRLDPTKANRTAYESKEECEEVIALFKAQGSPRHYRAAEYQCCDPQVAGAEKSEGVNQL